ncbi:MAG: DsrE family protein [Aquificota bacterium]|nr:DsrE family protein [Aquificota bacterium]
MSWIRNLFLCLFGAFTLVSYSGEFVQTDYRAPFRAVVEFYFDEPEKIKPALEWVSNIIYVLSREPYNFVPGEDIDIVVVIHGTEITTLVKKNRERYREIWERVEGMSMYGVKFKVCGMAAELIYGYKPEDFPEFVELVPSAITELLHWQQKGYALLIPRILERKKAVEEIR